MSRRGSAVNSQAGGTTSATVKSTYSGISGVAAGDIFVGIIGTNSGTVTLNSLLGAATGGHDWSAAVLSPAGALPKAGDNQAGNIETWLVVRQLTAQDITDGFVTATVSSATRVFFTAAVWTGGTGTWQTPPSVAKATASTLTGPSLTTVGINSDVVTVGGARNASLSTFPVISFGTGFTTDNTDGTANASSANEGGATGHLTTPVAGGTVVGGQSISATNTPTQIVAYLVELDPLTAKSLAETGSGADVFTVTISVPLTETSTGADAVTVAPSVSLAETSAGVESIAESVTATLADTGSGSEATSVAATIPTQTDVSTSVDALTVTPTLGLTEAGTGVDAINVNAGSTPVALSESGSIADALTLVPTLPAQTDTGHGTDAFAVVPAIPLPETSTAVDALAVVPTIPGQTDTGHGTDALTVAPSIPLTDTSPASDAVAVTPAIPGQSDTGLGTDGLQVAATAPLSDTSTSVDSITVIAGAQISLSDLASATEAFHVNVLTAMADAGQGVDVVHVIASAAAPPPASRTTAAVIGARSSPVSAGVRIVYPTDGRNLIHVSPTRTVEDTRDDLASRLG